MDKRPFLDIVAVGGLEPPTQPLTASSKPTELYGIPFLLYIAYYHRPSHARQPHPAFAFAGIIPAQQYGLTHYWCLLSGL